MTDKEILDGVLNEFYPLTKIPRPSGYEKAVSDYLESLLKSLGLKVVRDEKNNIIADKEGTKGFENAPLTILQSHMDMVCVAEEGKRFDPLKDGVTAVIDGEFLRAEGTSLGADDGMGIAEIVFLLKNLKEYGPLRIIFTVDEETGMTGAIALDPHYLTEATYLINCDSEDYDILTIGSAGGVNLDFTRPLAFETAQKGEAYRIELKGLVGGHSGEEINNGRANAIELLARAISAVSEIAGDIALADFFGGRAKNVIPSSAEAVIVTSFEERKLIAAFKACEEKFKSGYGKIEPSLSITVTKCEKPKNVFSSKDKDALLALILSLHNGVYAMSQVVSGMVETSANLGILKCEGGKIFLSLYPRSAVEEKIYEFCQSARALAKLSGFSLLQGTISPAWKERFGKLATYMTETFKEQNGFEMKVTSIHAGLECSWHIQKNPALDMVSIGVTTHDIHSPKERVELKTVAPQVRLIKGVLEKIAKFG